MRVTFSIFHPEMSLRVLATQVSENKSNLNFHEAIRPRNIASRVTVYIKLN